MFSDTMTVCTSFLSCFQSMLVLFQYMCMYGTEINIFIPCFPCFIVFGLCLLFLYLRLVIDTMLSNCVCYTCSLIN